MSEDIEKNIEDMKTIQKANPKFNAQDFMNLKFPNISITEYYRRLAGAEKIEYSDKKEIKE